jgi:hypothetical protein
MRALVGYPIVERLSGFHAFADRGGNLVRRQQGASIDRGRRGIRRMKRRRDRENGRAQRDREQPGQDISVCANHHNSGHHAAARATISLSRQDGTHKARCQQ